LEPSDHRALAERLAQIDPWAGLGYGAEALARYLGRPDPALIRFAVEHGEDSRAGLLAIRHPWLRGPYMEMLAIFPAHQGHGLGATVVAWAAAQARMNSANLWACVSDFNAPARRFYAAQGFMEVAPLDGLVSPGQSEILLRKRLG
jgi:ribosomal protein S18 acetylase RimI-like enzyme